MARTLLLLALAIGCGSGEPQRPVPTLVPSSSDPQRNVLVMDDGFDLAVPELRGVVAGAYTVVCRPSRPPPREPAELAEAKAQALAALRERDDQCHLEAGVEAKADPLA